MVVRRHASDLFVVGRPVVLPNDDPEQPPVTVWLQKLSPLDFQAVHRKANAAKAPILNAKLDRDSEEYQSILAQALETITDEEQARQFLAGDHLMTQTSVIAAQVEHAKADEPDEDGNDDGEWLKDGYLQGLMDAWADGLDRVYAEDAEDPEAKRVLAEIARFNAQIDERLTDERDDFLDTLANVPYEDLLHRCVELYIDTKAAQLYLDTQFRARIWCATRDCEGVDPDRPGKCLCRGSQKHRDPHFESLDQVRALPMIVFKALHDAYEEMSVDVVEGKDLPSRPASSPPSEPPETAGTSPASGLETATV